MPKEYIYKVEGMHCASCEILIEKKILEVKGVKSVSASVEKKEVAVECEGEKPSAQKLNNIFKENNYSFSESDKFHKRAGGKAEQSGRGLNPTLVGFNIALLIIIIFLILDRMGISGFLEVGSKSSLVSFFGFGILAGLSSCAALVGGIVLSMSKQWQSLYAENDGELKKFKPHILFNAGRIISYTILGGALGIIGGRLQISPKFSSLLIIAVSFLMIAMGLQMLGAKAFRKFRLALPKIFTRFAADEKNFQGKYMPFIMGALTFFLPCGFTITAQGLALLSGSALSGGLIMGAFALGTALPLLLIGLSSVKFLHKPVSAERFSKAAGFLVLFFALFNINSQMAVLGYNNLGNFAFWQGQSESAENFPPIVDGKQVIKMTALATKDDPDYFKVKAGLPVRWEITAGRSMGCNGAIVSQSLFEGYIQLSPGQTTVKEFTPQRSGRYRFSCSMGMISGIIEVVN